MDLLNYGIIEFVNYWIWELLNCWKCMETIAKPSIFKT